MSGFSVREGQVLNHYFIVWGHGNEGAMGPGPQTKKPWWTCPSQCKNLAKFLFARLSAPVRFVKRAGRGGEGFASCDTSST